MKKYLIIIAILSLFIPSFVLALPVYLPVQGGTGTSTKPTYGQVLVGDSLGLYDLVATSSLGIINGIQSLNGLTNLTQLFATTTAGTDFSIVSSSDTHTFNMPSSSSTTRGLLTSTDWITFNNKQNALTPDVDYMTVATYDPTSVADDAFDADNHAATTTYITSATNTQVILEDISESMYEQRFSGFISWDGAGDYYSVSSTTFTLRRGGEGYVQGKKVTWVGNQDIELESHECLLFYIDSSGLLQKEVLPFRIQLLDGISLFEAFYNGSNYEISKENHPYSFPVTVSDYNHLVIGSVLENSGGDMDRVSSGTGAGAGDRQIDIVGETYISDHGLRTLLPDTANSPITIKTYYTDGSGYWTKHLEQTELPMVYNNGGATTTIGTGKFGVFRIYGAKDDLNTSSPQFFGIIHTAQFNTIGQARSAIDSGVAAATNELCCLELVQLGYVIVENNVSGGYIAELQVAKEVLRSTLTGAGASNLASLVSVVTTNFDGWLSSLDTNVQNALETLDETAKDGTFRLENTADGTKLIALDLSGITTANTRTLTIPDNDGTLITSGNLTDIVEVGTIATGTWQGDVIAHEYGGLEADVSGFDGLLKISGGSTSQITDNSANWDDAYTKRVDSWTAPLVFSSNTASITQASSTANGYLSSTDWTTFNNKENALTFSTGLTRTNDTITTNDGEIDHDSLLNFTANEHFLQSAITEVGIVASGTWNGDAIGIAYGGTATTTMVSGEILFYNGSNVAQNSDLFWDNTNSRLGIASSTPQAKLSVQSTTEQIRLGYDNTKYQQFTVNSDGDLDIVGSNKAGNATTTIQNGGFEISNGTNGFRFYFGSGTSTIEAF